MAMRASELAELRRLVRERRAFEFSNFRSWNGTTIEHLYQASKTTDEEEKNWILEAPTPGEAKRRGNTKKIVHLRPNWDNKRTACMWRFICMAYKWGEPFGQQLMKSQGELVEWNVWHDTFWGKCVCEKHQGQGENWLGILLMLRRSQLWAGVKG